MQAIRNLVKHALHRRGFALTKLEDVQPSPLARLPIDVLFDIGANVGQYAIKARQAGYRKAIVSFEPLSAAWSQLQAHAANDALWQVHERCAVGAAAGEACINVAANSFSSSLLPMLAAHSDAAPHSAYVGTETTEVITLDSVFRQYCAPGKNAFVKIDTQGYEKSVLDGASAALAHATAVQLELSIVPLYGEQSLYDHFFDFFRQRDFVLWSVSPGFFDRQTGQLLQFDAVFVRQR